MGFDPTPHLFQSPDLDSMRSPRSPPVPKFDFPKFDGDNPRLWRDHCVLFFEVYGVHPAMRTRFAALNFQGPAATWLQTIERHGRITNWDQLCELVFAKYDKDQYQKHLRKLEQLKQTGTVTEYQAQFEQLAHGVLLYNPSYDHVYFVTRFLAGLKEEIRAPIALHRPRDVDTASALAMLQEEELNAVKIKNLGRGFYKAGSRETMEKGGADKMGLKNQKVEHEDKLSTLKQYRRKNGLCFKCGGKWSTTLTCPEHIPLHVLEELWDALEMNEVEGSEEMQSEDISAEDSVFALQTPEKEPQGRRQTLKLLARIGKQQVLVLVDSGSIGTFVSDRLVQVAGLQTQQCPVATFKAADGGQLHCVEKVPSLQWWVEGHRFISEARVLALRCYDMIVGEDWLEAVSPVWVDYKTKKMKITVKGRRVTLQGIQD